MLILSLLLFSTNVYASQDDFERLDSIYERQCDDGCQELAPSSRDVLPLVSVRKLPNQDLLVAIDGDPVSDRVDRALLLGIRLGFPYLYGANLRYEQAIRKRLFAFEVEYGAVSPFIHNFNAGADYYLPKRRMYIGVRYYRVVYDNFLMDEDYKFKWNAVGALLGYEIKFGAEKRSVVDLKAGAALIHQNPSHNIVAPDVSLSYRRVLFKKKKNTGGTGS